MQRLCRPFYTDFMSRIGWLLQVELSKESRGTSGKQKIYDDIGGQGA